MERLLPITARDFGSTTMRCPPRPVPSWWGRPAGGLTWSVKWRTGFAGRLAIERAPTLGQWLERYLNFRASTTASGSGTIRRDLAVFGGTRWKPSPGRYCSVCRRRFEPGRVGRVARLHVMVEHDPVVVFGEAVPVTSDACAAVRRCPEILTRKESVRH